MMVVGLSRLIIFLACLLGIAISLGKMGIISYQQMGLQVNSELLHSSVVISHLSRVMLGRIAIISRVRLVDWEVKEYYHYHQSSGALGSHIPRSTQTMHFLTLWLRFGEAK